MPRRLRLHHLGDDCLRHILVHLRRDRLGNETVPGLIFEARVWRRLGKRFLAVSRDTPSKFDARIAYTRDGVLPRSFTGGLRCSPAASVGMVVGDAGASGKGANEAPPRFRQEPQMFLLRAPHTGRVWAVCTGWRYVPPEGTAPNTVLLVQTVLALPHLVQLLSGQNANFDTRLDHFDKIVAGFEVKMTQNEYYGNQQSATGLVVPPMNRDSSAATERDCAVMWAKQPEGQRCKLSNRVVVVVGAEAQEVYLLERCSSTLRNDDRRYPKLPPVSIVLGFYDHPKVAECGNMQVGIHTHKLPKALMPRPKANDPELHLRILGRAALDRAERVASERNAIVVRRYQHGVLAAAARAGPSGVPSRRPRGAAVSARDGIRAGAQADNDTLSSGRLKFAKQLADDESREAEANGYVDDQYADLEEERDEQLLYDSDGEYDDRAPTRSKRVMAKERRVEVLAEEYRRARAWMIPSDDEDEADADAAAVEDL